MAQLGFFDAEKRLAASARPCPALPQELDGEPSDAPRAQR